MRSEPPACSTSPDLLAASNAALAPRGRRRSARPGRGCGAPARRGPRPDREADRDRRARPPPRKRPRECASPFSSLPLRALAASLTAWSARCGPRRGPLAWVCTRSSRLRAGGPRAGHGPPATPARSSSGAPRRGEASPEGALALTRSPRRLAGGPASTAAVHAASAARASAPPRRRRDPTAQGLLDRRAVFPS